MPAKSLNTLLRRWVRESDLPATISVARLGDKSSISAPIEINNQVGQLVIEARDIVGCIDVYIYYGKKFNEGRLEELDLLMGMIHRELDYGAFQVFSGGFVRWHQRTDFTVTMPTTRALSKLVASGWDIVEWYCPVISTVMTTESRASNEFCRFGSSLNVRNS